MKQIPKLSVIVPVFNTENYIARCIKSILDSDYTNIELILINDGSTDKSLEICREYYHVDKRIKLVNTSNGGVSKARNIGMNEATGDFITFVDSDDYVERDAYSNILESFSNNIDIVIFGSKTVTSNGRILKENTYPERLIRQQDIVENVIKMLDTAVWNKVFKSTYIKDVRFPEEYSHNEDLVFFCLCVNPDTIIKTIPVVGYNYVKHSNSLTSRPFSKKCLDEIKAKDFAASVIENKFAAIGIKVDMNSLRIRGRMNILRRMSSLRHNEMADERESIKHWLKSNVVCNKYSLLFRIYYYILMHNKLNRLVFGK